MKAFTHFLGKTLFYEGTGEIPLHRIKKYLDSVAETECRVLIYDKHGQDWNL